MNALASWLAISMLVALTDDYWLRIELAGCCKAHRHPVHSNHLNNFRTLLILVNCPAKVANTFVPTAARLLPCRICKPGLSSWALSSSCVVCCDCLVSLLIQLLCCGRLVNERHELKCKIAEFTGRPVLEGQEHLYDVEQYIQGEEPFCPKVEVRALILVLP